MNLSDVLQNFDVQKLMAMDKNRWRATLPVGDTVPANQMKPTTLSISKRGLFLCYGITGRFSTLAAGPVDNGICSLSFTLKNGSGRVYIQDPLYLDTFLTPGRVKDTAVPAAAAGGALQFAGVEFLTLFQPNDLLTFAVNNSAGYANSWQMSLHGFWLNG